MRHLLWIIVLLSAPLCARSAEELKNTDFTEGHADWQGDGESAAVAAEASSASASPSTPTANSGLVIKLLQDDWSKVTQDFEPISKKGTLTVTFKYSADLAFSSNGKEYKKVSHRLGFTALKNFHVQKGRWIAAIAEVEGKKKGRFVYYPVDSNPSTDVQTFTIEVSGLGTGDQRTLCLAFPPGTGSVTLLHVGLENE